MTRDGLWRVLIFATFITFGVFWLNYFLVEMAPLPQENWDLELWSPDYKNSTYVIDKQMVRLYNGVSDVAAAPPGGQAGSASKIVTRYFGNEARKDLNGDGKEDIVFLLTQDRGGSGIFYYVVVAVSKVVWKKEVYVGSQGYLLGDRIAPQTTTIGEGDLITVNYAVRKESDPFSTSPSVGKSAYLVFDPTTLTFKAK
jgi:hypothetical protein